MCNLIVYTYHMNVCLLDGREFMSIFLPPIMGNLNIYRLDVIPRRESCLPRPQRLTMKDQNDLDNNLDVNNNLV